MVHDRSRRETNSCCTQYSGTLCSWQFRSKAARRLLQILSQFWELLLVRAIPQPEPTHGVGDVPARIHSARLAHGKLQAFCGSTRTEVEAGTRTVKGP